MNTIPNQKNIAVLLLAAGASTRMRSPKQLLKWKEQPLISHCISNIKTSAVHEVFVLLGANYDEIYDEIMPFSIQILHHKQWKKGIGSSISYGVSEIINSKTCQYDGILILLADQPFVDQEYITKMIHLFEPKRRQIVVSQYYHKKMIYGVPAIFDQYYFSTLQKLSKDEGAKQIIKSNIDHLVPISHPDKLIDIDTDAQYQKYKVY